MQLQTGSSHISNSVRAHSSFPLQLNHLRAIDLNRQLVHPPGLRCNLVLPHQLESVPCSRNTTRFSPIRPRPMPPKSSLTSSFSASELDSEVVCPLKTVEGSNCRKRCLGVSALLAMAALAPSQASSRGHAPSSSMK